MTIDSVTPLAGPLALGYLLGTIPTAYWLTRWVYRLDIFQLGSKNMGATNVYRVLGAGPFALVLSIDLAKGYLATVLPRLLVIGGPSPFLAMIAGGVGAVLGHTLSFWVGFRGGKGVATGLGVFLALAPSASILALGLFLVAVWLTDYVSVGSCLGAVALPIFLHLTREGGDAHFVLWVAAAIVAVFIIIKHRANIGRLSRGEELPFRRSRPDAGSTRRKRRDRG